MCKNSIFTTLHEQLNEAQTKILSAASLVYLPVEGVPCWLFITRSSELLWPRDLNDSWHCSSDWFECRSLSSNKPPIGEHEERMEAQRHRGTDCQRDVSRACHDLSWRDMLRQNSWSFRVIHSTSIWILSKKLGMLLHN